MHLHILVHFYCGSLQKASSQWSDIKQPHEVWPTAMYDYIRLNTASEQAAAQSETQIKSSVQMGKKRTPRSEKGEWETLRLTGSNWNLKPK